MSSARAMCGDCGRVARGLVDVDSTECPECGAVDWQVQSFAIGEVSSPSTDRGSFTAYRVLHEFDKEMRRQDKMWGANRHMSDADFFATFMCEVGEISLALTGRAPEGHGVLEEIVHAAAVLGQWAKDKKTRR